MAWACSVAEEAEGVELAHGVREEVDADAEGTYLARRFEHLHLHADLVEAERRRQSSDARADDRATQDGPGLVHRTSCTWMRTVLRSRSPVETARMSLHHARRGAAVDSRTSVRK